MKNLKAIIMAIVIFGVVALQIVNAATVEFRVGLTEKSYLPQTEITVPILVKSTDATNAYTVDLEFQNLEYIEAKPSQNWTQISGPTIDNNKVSFTAALLGKDKYIAGENEIMNVKFKTPESGKFMLKGSGMIALTNGDASILNGSFQEKNYSINEPGSNSEQSSESMFASMPKWLLIGGGILATLIILISGYFIFKRRD